MTPAAPVPADVNGGLRIGIEQAAEQLALALSPVQVDGLVAYLLLLQRWNRTYNLTAVRDPQQMLTQHLADCLAGVGPLRRELASHAAPRILDVGSGGGLPGVVIAALNPAWQVLCVDAVGKKAAFITQVAGELKLRNLQAAHARVEGLVQGKFELITSRAFAALADFVRLTEALLASGACWMAMKGKPPLDEIALLPERITVFHVEPLSVPGLNAERCLVWMKPGL